LAIAVVGNIDVVVRTRGEHCPPDVHADCAAEGWDARFRFSFLDDEVEHWDTRPKRRAPNLATLNRVGAVIFANLAACRRRWWETMRTTCLHNQPVRLLGGKLMPCSPAAPGAGRVTAASYDPSTREPVVDLADGSTHRP
jgi:hypothetical protein